MHLPFRHDRHCYQARTRHNLTTWSCEDNLVLQKLGCKKAMQGHLKILRSLDMKDSSAPAWQLEIATVPRLPHSLHAVQAAAQHTVCRKRYRTGLPSMFEALRIKPCGVQASGLGMFLPDFRGPSKTSVTNNNARPVTALRCKMRTRLSSSPGHH